MFSFHYLKDAPIISVEEHPWLDGNANGPSLIAAPEWLVDPPGKYLLYFAHHEGHSIRLAASNNLVGPWKIISPDPLNLEKSLFASTPPSDTQLHPEARQYIEDGADGDYPHIASPDVWVDHETEQIRLYYHGRLEDGRQRSRVALSRDGINFAGLGNFEAGPRLTTEAIRHHALLQYNDQWFVLWTRVGDSPERILLSILDTPDDWQQWGFAETCEIHRAQKTWEGADIAPRASQYGAIMERVNQLRDPAIFVEDGKIYLLYAIAGEQGIAIGELRKL
jgi:hypothetical protein